MLIKIPSLVSSGTTWRLSTQIVEPGCKGALGLRPLICASTEASTPNREPIEANDSSSPTTYWDSLPLNAPAGSNSVALTGLAQRSASTKPRRHLPNPIHHPLWEPNCPLPLSVIDPSTSARSGGSKYSSAMSASLASNSGSVLNLKVSTRCGWSPYLSQMRYGH